MTTKRVLEPGYYSEKNIPQWGILMQILMQIRISRIKYKFAHIISKCLYVNVGFQHCKPVMHFHIKFFRFETHSEKERETKKEYKRAVRQNDARAELTKARFSALVSTSLQPCSLKNNQTILERICKDKAEGKSKKIQGLLAVLHNIQSEHIAQDRKEYEASFLSFDDAMEIYFAYQNQSLPFSHHDKDNFTYALLNKNWGLCVHIIYFKK